MRIPIPTSGQRGYVWLESVHSLSLCKTCLFDKKTIRHSFCNAEDKCYSEENIELWSFMSGTWWIAASIFLGWKMPCWRIRIAHQSCTFQAPATQTEQSKSAARSNNQICILSFLWWPFGLGVLKCSYFPPCFSWSKVFLLFMHLLPGNLMPQLEYLHLWKKHDSSWSPNEKCDTELYVYFSDAVEAQWE